MRNDLPIKRCVVDLSTDLSVSGNIVIKNVISNPIGFGCLLIQNPDGDLIPKVYGSTPVFGGVPYLAIESGTGLRRVLCWGGGFVRNDAWSFTVGEHVSIDILTPGQLSQTLGFLSESFGYAEDTHILYFGESHKSIDIESIESIDFTHTGQTFSPIIETVGDPIVEWLFEDGSISDELNPSVDFGSESSRLTRLKVTPWTGLTMINVGFDGSDGGWNQATNPSRYFTDLEQQNVSAIDNVNYATNLEMFAASYSEITDLDFSDCAELMCIELYHGNIESGETLNVSGCLALERICVENTGISGVLDLSDCPIMGDVRCATNNLSEINWGDPPASTDAIWHICARNNPYTVQHPSPSIYPHLIEYLMHDANIVGSLVFNSDSLDTLWLQNNAITSLDVSCGINGYIRCDNNQITSIDISNCNHLDQINANNNQLDQDAVDLILTTFDAFGTSGSGTIDLQNNAIPSATGLAAAASIEGRGFTVLVDS